MIIPIIWDLHILVEYLAAYCLPAFPIISHVSPSLFPLSGIPDPEGAAILLETVAKVTWYDELRIDVKQLRQQGNHVKKNLAKIAKSIRAQQKTMNDNGEGQNEENLMYG